MRFLLVAKPWRGGLGRYLFLALESMFPGSVEWIPTYPERPGERLRHFTGRTRWRERLHRRVAAPCTAAIFVNPPATLGELEPRDNWVLWVTDDPRDAIPTLDPYGRVFVSDPGFAEDAALAFGPRFLGVLPFAHLASVHQPAPSRARRGICLIGNADRKRDAHVETLLAAGAELRVIGNYFVRHRLFWRHPTHFRPSIPNRAMGAIYAEFALGLNVHAEVIRGGTNMRSFECAGYGIPQVIERRPGLEALLTPGVECAVYDEPAELPALVADLLAAPTRAAAMARRARRRALAEHRYEHRLAKMLEGLVPRADLAPWRIAAPEA